MKATAASGNVASYICVDAAEILSWMRAAIAHQWRSLWPNFNQERRPGPERFGSEVL
jgi:hypothetical protein